MIKNANEIKSIEIYHRGAIKVIDLSIFRIDENDMITISMNIEGENYSYTSNNYFDAFCDARNDQEKNDITFCCNGARMNVYPSRMSLQMSLGRKAYEFELGLPAKKIVDIFDKCDIETIVNVSEQREFYQIWIDSLRR
jgi:hypothetical protein